MSDPVMTEDLDDVRPDTVQANAWSGSPLHSPLSEKTEWEDIRLPLTSMGLPQWKERDWRHPKVGWGLVLPDNPNLSPSELATADDAPRSIRQLVKCREGSVVLRWADVQTGYLRRYYANEAKPQTISNGSLNVGTASGCIPRYLLIAASPKEIPWSVQYSLNMGRYVGRLDLPEKGLDNYVEALLSDWSGQTLSPRSPLIWSVDHGGSDITALMTRVIGERLWTDFTSCPEVFSGRFLRDDQASREQLVSSLMELSPGLVVTTSHGMTGPLDGSSQILDRLGCPVDCNHNVVLPDDLKGWAPSGAIWYSHACCAAGSDEKSRYERLFAPDTAVGGMLRGIAKTAGSVVAPMAQAMLSHERPLRAFVGHVEPTFDWTLRESANRQVVTQVLSSALYDRLFDRLQGNPIGWALSTVFQEAASYIALASDAEAEARNGKANLSDRALYCRLVAMDRRTTVILGDPTVSFGPLDRK